MGVTEDMIAVYVVTGIHITWRAIFIIILVAIPFAILGELIVDRIDISRKSKS